MTPSQRKILRQIKKDRPKNPMRYMRELVGEYAIENLNDIILRDDSITSGKNEKSIAFGNPSSDLMIIGESVSPVQVKAGDGPHIPLKGTVPGEMLQKVLDHFGVNPDEVFYINAVSSFTYKQVDGKKLPRTPSKSEVEASKDYLFHAIDIVRPSVIIILGSIALNVFQSGAITQLRGEWITAQGIKAMPTYHPDYFIHLEGRKDKDIIDMHKSLFTEDIQKALLYIQEEYPDNNVLTKFIDKDY